jgi:hypothetical protein
MLIGSSQRLSKIDSITISINDSALANVQSFLYLGILVNRYCTWGDHVDYISSKIYKKFGLLKHIKSCLPLDARITKFYI